MNSKEYANVGDAFGEILGNDASLALKEQIEKRRIVNALAAIRVTRGVTQENIATVLGCQQGKISKLENGLDADLRFSELEAYARATGCEVTIIFSERGRSLADKIKHFAFGIRAAFLKLADLAHKDEAIAKGVADLNAQAFRNINRFLQESSAKLPLCPENGQPYIQIAPCDMLDNDDSDTEDVAARRPARGREPVVA
ncbi:MAG: helix-turn-helix transcriptional regulator [Planctomycetales bacterium]